MSQVNPPSAAVMKQALAVIVQRQEATKTNIQKTKTELANLQKKSKPVIMLQWSPLADGANSRCFLERYGPLQEEDQESRDGAR